MKHTKPRFGSSICFGITVGLWLAGLMDLAYVEVGIAMLLTVTLMEKKKGATFSAAKGLCGAYALLDVLRQCFVFGGGM